MPEVESSSGSSSSTALATSGGDKLVKTHVPQGVRIKWYQRKETIWIDIEAPDIEVEEVVWDDDGLIEVKAKEARHCLTLQLLHRIHTYDSRWWISGRCLKMEVAKAEYGLAHWQRLTVGEKLPNVLIDWTSWIDEAEEAEVRMRRRTFLGPRSALPLLAPSSALAPTDSERRAASRYVAMARRFATRRMGTTRAPWPAPWANTGAATSSARSKRRRRPKR